MALTNLPFIWKYGERCSIRTVELSLGKRPCAEEEPWREWGCPVAWFSLKRQEEFLTLLKDYAKQAPGARLFTPLVPNHQIHYHPVFNDQELMIELGWAAAESVMPLGEYIDKQITLYRMAGMEDPFVHLQAGDPVSGA